ncbi:MAG: polyprenyl synthetase family protein [Alphaproteobacteria bacterium]
MSPLLQEAQREVEKSVRGVLKELLEVLQGPSSLKEVMAYAVLGPGKCFRPLLVFGAGELFRLPASQLLRVAASVEVIHAYSLIHDDLPAMDDADMRRGRLSTHKAFSEALAILAGDALIPLAFEIITNLHTSPFPEKRLGLCRLLAQLIGSEGLVAGQVLDICATLSDTTPEKLRKIQILKTGTLFSYCLQATALLGDASPEQRQALQVYGDNLALVFQMADDLLELASVSQTGKQHAHASVTWPTLVGEVETHEARDRCVKHALDALTLFGKEAQLLRELLQFSAFRTH